MGGGAATLASGKSYESTTASHADAQSGAGVFGNVNIGGGNSVVWIAAIAGAVALIFFLKK